MPSEPTVRRLLVVDDHAGLRELFKINMEREGFKVAEAEDGIEGLAKAKSFKPDLIVLDMMMPKLNGLEMLQRMKEKGLAQVPVIVITAYGETFDEAKTRAQPNVRDYMKKPFKFDDLAARIRKVLDAPVR